MSQGIKQALKMHERLLSVIKLVCSVWRLWSNTITTSGYDWSGLTRRNNCSHWLIYFWQILSLNGNLLYILYPDCLSVFLTEINPNRCVYTNSAQHSPVSWLDAPISIPLLPCTSVYSICSCSFLVIKLLILIVKLSYILITSAHVMPTETLIFFFFFIQF